MTESVTLKEIHRELRMIRKDLLQLKRKLILEDFPLEDEIEAIEDYRKRRKKIKWVQIDE